MHTMSTNFAKTLVWKHGNDVKLWRHKQCTPQTNNHHMTLNQTPPWKFSAYATVRGDNARVFQRISIPQYHGWPSRMPTYVSIYSIHAGCVRRLLNRTDCYASIRRKNLWLFVFETNLISGITEGGQGCEPPLPGKLNVKPGPPPNLFFGIYYSFRFQ